MKDSLLFEQQEAVPVPEVEREGMAVCVMEGGGTTFGVTAVTLEAMTVVDANGGQAAESLTAWKYVLQRRMTDLLRGIHDCGEDITLEMRILNDRVHPRALRTYFLASKRADGSQDGIADATREIGGALRNLLSAHMHGYEFRPVTRNDELRHLLSPFAPGDVASVLRREECLELDTDDGLIPSRMGFRGEPPSASRTDRGSIHYVFPLTYSGDDLSRLCAHLLKQAEPVYFGVCIRPYRLTEFDNQAMRERIARCESYAQMGVGGGDPERIRPYLQHLARDLYHRCFDEYAHLRDAAFLMDIRLVASGTISDDLLAVAGVSVSAPAGCDGRQALRHPHGLEGGYSIARPTDDKQLKKAIAVADTLGNGEWWSSAASDSCNHWRSLVTAQQAVAAFRLPGPSAVSFPGISTAYHEPQTAPSGLPEKGLLFGKNLSMDGRWDVRCLREDRRRHLYVVGQTGTGKSTFFETMIRQDMQDGEGLCVIDPHGELVDRVIALVPDERENDVILIDPADFCHPVGINMLEVTDCLEKDFVANYILEMFAMMYNMQLCGGPMFEMYMRSVLQVLLSQPPEFRPNLLNVMEFFQDTEYRDSLLRSCTDKVAVAAVNLASKTGGEHSWNHMGPWIVSKLSRFYLNKSVRTILCQKDNCIDFQDVMNKRRIVLVRLSKGELGATVCQFIGMLVTGKIFNAALGRSRLKGKSEMPDFHLYVDEFHTMATPTFINILSEARKYHLSLMLTNQYISQLPDDIVKGILGNVGTLVSFRVGSADAPIMVKEMGGGVTAQDLISLPNWTAYVKFPYRGQVLAPFDINTLSPFQISEQAAHGKTQRIKGLQDRQQKLFRLSEEGVR
jgi:hypothetical protein